MLQKSRVRSHFFLQRDSSTKQGVPLSAFLLIALMIFVGTIDWFSVFFVNAGVIVAGVLAHSPGEICNTYFLIFFRSLSCPMDADRQRIATMVRYSEIVRSQGLLALEKEAGKVNDPFLRFALKALVDESDISRVEELLSLRSRSLNRVFECQESVLTYLANTSSAMGLLGTIVGLVRMLGGVGPEREITDAMSLALLSTLYGTSLCYMVLIPVRERLTHTKGIYERLRQITAAATLDIRKELSPRIVQHHLEAMLTSVEDVQYG